jgi:hypothetical protein
MRSAYELWTWKRCRERILSLKQRLGYDERLWILGFELLDDGRLVDRYHEVEVFDPAHDVSATAVSYRYSAVPELYCILFTYAAASETPLTGERQSVSALDPLRRAGLSVEDCVALLSYAVRDLSALQAAVRVPFFGEVLNEGEYAFEVNPLPRVPLTIVLWRGDEEVSDSGTLLFDASAGAYLPGLLRELARLTVWRLKNILDVEFKWGYHR